MTEREVFTMTKPTFDETNFLYAVEWMLKDYLHKLERDDYDFAAVEKMKSVNNVLDYIKGRYES